MTTRNNPCKGHEVGCTADPAPGARRCDNCRAVHNAREAKRRELRRKHCLCWVCGAEARVLDGVYLATCEQHASYSTDVRSA
jgi:hypothetical protein